MIEKIYMQVVNNGWIFSRLFYSLIISLFIAFCATIISLLVAVALTYGKIKFKNIILVMILFLFFMPMQTTLLPNYLALKDLKIFDTVFALILPGIFSPFSVLLMYFFLSKLDGAVVEAAKLETSSLIAILLHIIIPQMRYCIITVFVFLFAEAFNCIEQSIYFVKKDSLKIIFVWMKDNLVDEKMYGVVSIICTILFVSVFLLSSKSIKNNIDEYL